ncbi:hypothetical protein G6F50_017226 [Rhizopus delemar]|uniref:Uncharacterized protein n=1 Tax=Rhizopus delemar TaxID=936053 RepID=A0A9P6XQS6_9FUNG|nr:hypothetical protein G6F50_017226 [Rhizopus delemar]
MWPVRTGTPGTGTPGTGTPGTGTPGTGGTAPVTPPLAAGLLNIAGTLNNDGGRIEATGDLQLSARNSLDNSDGGGQRAGAAAGQQQRTHDVRAWL